MFLLEVQVNEMKHILSIIALAWVFIGCACNDLEHADYALKEETDIVVGILAPPGRHVMGELVVTGTRPTEVFVGHLLKKFSPDSVYDPIFDSLQNDMTRYVLFGIMNSKFTGVRIIDDDIVHVSVSDDQSTLNLTSIGYGVWRDIQNQITILPGESYYLEILKTNGTIYRDTTMIPGDLSITYPSYGDTIVARNVFTWSVPNCDFTFWDHVWYTQSVGAYCYAGYKSVDQPYHHSGLHMRFFEEVSYESNFNWSETVSGPPGVATFGQTQWNEHTILAVDSNMATSLSGYGFGGSTGGLAWDYILAQDLKQPIDRTTITGGAAGCFGSYNSVYIKFFGRCPIDTIPDQCLPDSLK
jgi:hypothetical protein